MKRYNVIAVYSPDRTKLLMCLRAKNPYKGLLNFVGGKIEEGETDLDAAYRELEEETGITRGMITLTHVVDFTYYHSGIVLMAYAGRLRCEPQLREEENALLWVKRTEDFNDASRFAGDCNIEHILRQAEYYADEALG